MIGAVFFDTLRYAWKNMLLWGLGLTAYATLVVMMLPALDALDFGAILETFPPFMLSMLGVGEDIEFAVSPPGLLALTVFGEAVIMFMPYPVIVGLAVTATDEDEGRMDVLLSLPVPRWRFLIERYAAYALTLAGLALMCFGGMWLGAQTITLSLDMGRLAVAALNLLPMLLFVMTLTAFVGTVTRRSTALAVMTAFIVGSFIIESISGITEAALAGALETVSFLTYFDASGTMQNGISPVNVGILLGLAVLLLGGALLAFQRRDISV